MPTSAGWDRGHEATRLLLGEHDFAGFQAAECVATDSVRRLDTVEWVQGGAGPHHYELVVVGTAFLRNMVRIIAGTMLDVVFGRISLERLSEALSTGKRSLAGQTAPPHGLVLEEVFYPEFPWSQAAWTMPPSGG
jgi:tRNA pseudouridine38-40 synthase